MSTESTAGPRIIRVLAVARHKGGDGPSIEVTIHPLAKKQSHSVDLL